MPTITTNVVSGGGAALDGVEIASPWRRWSARLFDNWLGGIAAVILVSVLASGNLPNAAQSLIYLPLALGVEALEYWAFGGTFGKWVFSVKVLDSKGEKIGGAEYGKRLLPIWVAGLGLGIPLAALITELWQYRRLQKGLAASYDERAGRIVVQYKQGFAKGLVCVLFLLVMLALFITCLALSVFTIRDFGDPGTSWQGL